MSGCPRSCSNMTDMDTVLYWWAVGPTRTDNVEHSPTVKQQRHKLTILLPLMGTFSLGTINTALDIRVWVWNNFCHAREIQQTVRPVVTELPVPAQMLSLVPPRRLSRISFFTISRIPYPLICERIPGILGTSGVRLTILGILMYSQSYLYLFSVRQFISLSLSIYSVPNLTLRPQIILSF
jgi:hypothetical protein